MLNRNFLQEKKRVGMEIDSLGLRYVPAVPTIQVIWDFPNY